MATAMYKETFGTGSTYTVIKHQKSKFQIGQTEDVGNRVLRGEVTGGLREGHNEELHNLYSTPGGLDGQGT
jgi:hypothetical protein